MNGQLLAAAPMEGLTTAVFRRLHHQYFGGTDLYYIPFITPTVEPKFTDRHLKELSPEVNAGIPVVPQLLSNRSADFIWAAKALQDLGYKEVNLNLGCPSGTVVVKGKGSGFLRDLYALERFLDEIFSAGITVPISIKTRLGWANTEEFGDILNLYKKYPLSLLIVHMRLKTDQYKGEVRKEALLEHLDEIPFPLGVNGDMITTSDMTDFSQMFREPKMLMVGRSLMADPALFRKYKGGPAAALEEIKNFTTALFDAYTEAFQNRRNAMMRMKEFWFFQANLFEENPKAFKNIFKSKTEEDFLAAVEEIEAGRLLTDARFGWKKPL